MGQGWQRVFHGRYISCFESDIDIIPKDKWLLIRNGQHTLRFQWVFATFCCWGPTFVDIQIRRGLLVQPIAVVHARIWTNLSCSFPWVKVVASEVKSIGVWGVLFLAPFRGFLNKRRPSSTESPPLFWESLFSDHFFFSKSLSRCRHFRSPGFPFPRFGFLYGYEFKKGTPFLQVVGGQKPLPSDGCPNQGLASQSSSEICRSRRREVPGAGSAAPARGPSGAAGHGSGGRQRGSGARGKWEVHGGHVPGNSPGRTT